MRILHENTQRVLRSLRDPKRVQQKLHRWRYRLTTPSVFIWIPKTAGTSVYRALAPYGCRKLNNQELIDAQFDNNGCVTFGHFDYAGLVASEHVSTEFDATSYKFAFVRNPFGRMVSLWEYLRRGVVLDTDLPFDAFVERVSQGVSPVGPYNRRDLSQCNPQVDWLITQDRWLTDYVGRYENLKADFEHICGELGLPYIELPHRNQSTDGTYRSYYTSFSRDLVATLYEKDLNTFNYSF